MALTTATRRHGMIAQTLACALVACTLSLVAPRNASAQTSFVTPFPQDGTYRVFVFGDALGNGLFTGLKAGLKLEPDIRVDDQAVGNSRLSRDRPVNWIERMETTVRDTPFEIAVMTFGVSDRGTMRIDGRRYGVDTPEWENAYGKRVDALLRAAKAKGAAVYWVGLPIMKGAQASRDAQIVNAIARERVYRLGGKFIDTWAGFTDAEGKFSPYGPDLTGKIRRLRAKDGVYFTTRGYRKLSHYVERLIRRDLAQARAERDVPLAGDSREQAQVRSLVNRRAGTSKQVRQDSLPDARRKPGEPRAPKTSHHKAAHAMVRVAVPAASGKPAKTVQVRIVRPALPAVVVSHIQRRSKSAGADRLGRNLLQFDAYGNGLINSVVSVPDATGSDLSTRVSVTQSPYYKALIKGEALQARPGRTDDFSWPPQNRTPMPGAGSPRGS